MKCPSCKDTALLLSERKGIEIDYCPECRGIWLDRGELDKLIAADENPAPSRNDYNNQQKTYKKKSFLSELFD